MANLVIFLTQIVDTRIAMKQVMEGGGIMQMAGFDACLRAQEFYSHQNLLEHMRNKKLDENRSWIEENDYIDLGNIGADDKEQQKRWPYRLIKQNGPIKSLKINRNELMDFLNIAKSTFGAFQIDDNHNKRYVVISITFEQQTLRLSHPLYSFEQPRLLVT